VVACSVMLVFLLALKQYVLIFDERGLNIEFVKYLYIIGIYFSFLVTFTCD
jgi:hypothetical protein